MLVISFMPGLHLPSICSHTCGRNVEWLRLRWSHSRYTECHRTGPGQYSRDRMQQCDITPPRQQWCGGLACCGAAVRVLAKRGRGWSVAFVFYQDQDTCSME